MGHLSKGSEESSYCPGGLQGLASPVFLTSHKSLSMWSPRAWKEARDVGPVLGQLGQAGLMWGEHLRVFVSS